MSNGKFFSGLPDSMLRGSSNRPDRMESHLFWPDESKTDGGNSNSSSNTTTPLKRATKQVPEPDVQYYKEFQSDTPTSKELFSKHQTSKIQFNDYADDDGGNSSGVRNNNRNNNKSSAPMKNVNITNNYNNRVGNTDHSAKLNALKSNIGFYDYPDESRVSKTTATTRSSNRQNEISPKQNEATTKKNQQQQDYNYYQSDRQNNTVNKSRSDENVLKCKMNNDLYDLDKKVNNLNVNNISEYSVNKNARIIDSTNNGGGGNYEIPIKVHIETTDSSISYNSSRRQRDHQNSQQYQNTQNVPISLDHDYVPGRSSRGCPVKSYNNITPLYSQQEQSPVIHAKSRAHDHLKSNIFFHNNSHNTSPPATQTRQQRPLSVRDSAVCRVGVGLPDM